MTEEIFLALTEIASHLAILKPSPAWIPLTMTPDGYQTRWNAETSLLIEEIIDGDRWQTQYCHQDIDTMHQAVMLAALLTTEYQNNQKRKPKPSDNDDVEF